MARGWKGLDRLDGGSGADRMEGGSETDVYYVDNGADQVVERAGEGTDLVYSSITFALPDYVENLALTGTAAIDATGNALSNTLTGNDAANTLAGGSGDDTLKGKGGVDRLDGGSGGDRMEGGSDTDVYYVDNGADQVVERAGEGTDLVYSSITFALPDYVENLALTGTAAIDATGNALSNTLTGNDAANTLAGGSGDDTLKGKGGVDRLDGGSGGDRMEGGSDTDVYSVDNGADQVVERAGEGTDLVYSSITFALPDYVENLALTGTAAIDATGNALYNTLTGNDAANTLAGGSGDDTLKGKGGVDRLDGGSGGDRMEGGSDTDVYYVDNGADQVVERAGEGTDLVYSSITFALPDYVENLALTGAAAIDATGNALSNTLTGNDAANTLAGGSGDDTLKGKGGVDRLDGGSGADRMEGGSDTDVYSLDNGGDHRRAGRRRHRSRLQFVTSRCRTTSRTSPSPGPPRSTRPATRSRT